MKDVTKIDLWGNSREEHLPGFDTGFPCVTTRALLDEYVQPVVPWHWHNAVELFYVQSGNVQYQTPRELVTFYSGSGGLVNSGVLHMTTHRCGGTPNIQLLHFIDPLFLAGYHGSRIEKKYIKPITACTQLELLPIFPDRAENSVLLAELRDSFEIGPNEQGYELLLREKLSHIWLRIYAMVHLQLEQQAGLWQSSDRTKLMMAYIHEHYMAPIRIKTLADEAFCSQRECYRAFQSCLHMTPTEYLQSYRLQMACQMLLTGKATLTVIAHNCGFSSSSYFGKVFRDAYGCTPMQYRELQNDCRADSHNP